MSDPDRRESNRVASRWQETLAAIRGGEHVRLAARWIFPVSSPPIENGLLEIADGRIDTVEPLAGRSCPDAVDLGNSAILPSLVNAHAHLEFSDLAAPIQPPAPFADWIQNLIAHRNARSEPMSSLVARGARQSAESGTSIVGDIVTGQWLPDEATQAGSKLVAFRELIGLLPEQHDQQLQIANDHIAACRDAGVQPAISPHASFSVSPRLFSSLVDLAKTEGVPLCVHLAETKAELELLEFGTGELVEMLKKFGIWNGDLVARETRPLDFLKPLAELPAAAIAHGNYLSDDEIHFLARHPNVTTIFCPRTHRFFGHEAHPWRRLLDQGASVALGTDGRSSNPDYSLWAELQFLDRETNGGARPELLHMATRNGAEALGLAEFGTLEKEHHTMPTLVPFGENTTTDPWSALFHSALFPSLARSGT